MVNKGVQNAVLGCNLKNDRMSCLFPRQTIQYHSNPTSNAEEAEVERFYEDLQHLLELTHTHKDALFHDSRFECKSRKSGDTQGNGKFWTWIENEASKRLTVLSRECTGHSKHHFPTTQKTILHMGITGWSILQSDWLYSLQPKMEKLYTVSKNKTGSWLWLRSWTPYCQIQT